MNVATIECPRCGASAQLATSALLVEVDGLDPVDVRLAGTVAWICEECTDLVADPITWALLLSLVASLGRRRCAPSRGPARPRTAVSPGAPAEWACVTPNDLLDLHQAIEEPGWLDQLLSPVESASEALQ